MDILLEEAERLIHQGELKEALELIHTYGEGTSAKEQFMEWMSGYFGYQVEKKDQQRIETLRFPIYRPINALDPAYSFYTFDAHMIKQVFNTLEVYAGSRLLTLNLSKPGLLQDLKFRKALNQAINRQQMIEEIGEPRMYPSKGFQLKDEPVKIDEEHDPDKVKSLLAQTGYAGEPIQLCAYERHAIDAYWIRGLIAC